MSHWKAATAVGLCTTALVAAREARADEVGLPPARDAVEASLEPPPPPPPVSSTPLVAGGVTVLSLGVGALVGDGFAIASTLESGSCPKGDGEPVDCGSAFFGEVFLTAAGLAGVIGGSVMIASGARGDGPAESGALRVGVGPGGGWAQLAW